MRITAVIREEDFVRENPHCFLCGRFARVEDLVLLRNKKNGIRRWFHRKGTPRACVTKFPSIEYWEEVDPSLGETTEEEERKLAQLE